MADHDDLDAVELASAYLDGEATSAERARVEGDPSLLAEVERLRRVRDAVAATMPAPAAQREAAIAAALSTFDELQVDAASPPNVVSIAGRRTARWRQGLTTAAAAAVLVLGGFVIANRGGGEDNTAGEVRQADATAPGAAAAPSATTSTPAAPDEAATGTAASNSEASVAEREVDAPLAAAPTEIAAAQVATTAMATSETAMDAAAAAPAPGGEPPVLRDADELRSFAESLDVAPPSLADVVADCETEPRPSPPDAVFEEADGTVTDVAVASTTDGYAAVSLDDCTIVVRTPSASD